MRKLDFSKMSSAGFKPGDKVYAQHFRFVVERVSGPTIKNVFVRSDDPCVKWESSLADVYKYFELPVQDRDQIVLNDEFLLHLRGVCGHKTWYECRKYLPEVNRI